MSKKCHVLAVEDDPLVQDLFAQIFTAEGFDFSIAANGQQMREIIASHEVHIVLMDVVLPGGETGLDLAEELIASGHAVIFVTGSHDYFERVEQSGLRYLHKPFRIPTLLQAIATVLREAHANCDHGSIGEGCNAPTIGGDGPLH
jgi:two-component system phosphate regulon response regulator OmpR